MSWSDWLNIAASAGDIAGSIANLLGDEKSTTGPAFTLGSVEFGNNGGTMYAQNTSPDTEVLLNYAMPVQQESGPIATATSFTSLAANGGYYDPASDLMQFTSGGTLTVNAITPATTDGGVSALGFAVASIALSASIVIVGGINASFNKTATGYTFSINATNGAMLNSAKVTVQGTNGVKCQTSMTFSNQSDDGSSGTVDLPPGLVIDPIVAMLNVDLLVDTSSIKEFLRVARSKSYPGSAFRKSR